MRRDRITIYRGTTGDIDYAGWSLVQVPGLVAFKDEDGAWRVGHKPTKLLLPQSFGTRRQAIDTISAVAHIDWLKVDRKHRIAGRAWRQALQGVD